jgi:hypothetical protein
MANVDKIIGFRCIGTLSGATPRKFPMTLAGSQTVAVGDPLIATSIGSAATVEIALYTSSLIHGVCGEAATATGEIQAWPADPDYLFEAQCSGTYAAASHLFKCVDIEGTTGIMEVNEDSSTYAVFQILGLVDSDDNAAGENARVYGRFVRSSFSPLLGLALSTVNGSGSADLTSWTDSFSGAEGADDEDPKYALTFNHNGTLYYVPAFTSI